MRLFCADIVVVGGGPAGLMAAVAAAESGAQVVVLERLSRPGNKLVATGGGRCNLTNTLDTAEYLARFGKQGNFMRPALAGLNAPGLLAFFKSLGVETHCADGFHYFPVSESAVQIRDVLTARCRAMGVDIRTGAEALSLRVEEGRIRGIETNSGLVEVSAVILAAGGCAWPELGSNGSGFELARTAGHSIVPPVPALVPLVTRQDWPRRCAGIVVQGARLRIDLPKASRTGMTGDLLFTHRGLSGPAALDLSGEIARRMEDSGQPLPLRLHLTNEQSPEVWSGRINGWRTEHPKRLVRNLVSEQLPHSLAEAACGETGIGAELRAADLPKTTARALADWLAGVVVEITGTEGFNRAMVCAGGVSTREADPKTLQSKVAAGLFFAGEVLDIDGPCGGYNLQWAFSSGRLAGRSAAEIVRG